VILGAPVAVVKGTYQFLVGGWDDTHEQSDTRQGAEARYLPELQWLR